MSALREGIVALPTAVLLLLTANAATAAVALDQEPSAPLVGTTRNNTFAPEAVTITEGQSVGFANVPVPTLPGGVRSGPHNLVINDEQVEPTAMFWSRSHTFPTAGTFTFYCSLHGSPTGGMRGFVIVTPAETPPPPIVIEEGDGFDPPIPPKPPLTGGGQGDSTSTPAPSRPTDHPRIVYRVDHWWDWTTTTTTPTSLTLSLNRRRTTVRVSCSGRGCPFRARARVIRGGRVDIAPWFGRAAMAPGTRIRILLLKRGFIGQSLEFRLRREAVPRSTRRCVPAGSRQPARRCV